MLVVGWCCLVFVVCCVGLCLLVTCCLLFGVSCVLFVGCCFKCVVCGLWFVVNCL